MPDLGDSPSPNLPTLKIGGKPKFSRPGISLSRPIKKEWRHVDPSEVDLGDVIFGFGQVAHKSKLVGAQMGVLFENVMGDQKIFGVEQIKAFVVAK